MHELERRIVLNVIRFTDLSVMVAAFGFAFLMAGQYVQAGSLNEYFAVRIKLSNFIFFFGWLITWYFLLKSFKLYKTRRSGLMAAEWWAATKAVTTGTLLLSFASVLLDLATIGPVFLVSFFFASLLGTLIARFLLRSFFTESGRNGGTLRRLAIVGCGPRGAEFGKKIRNRPDFGYLLLGYIDELPPPDNPLHGGPENILGPPDQIRELIETNDVDEIVITLPIASYYQTISNVISVCEELAVDVLIPSDFFQSRLANVAVDDSRAWPAMELSSSLPSAGGFVIKRVIDVFGSLFALFFLSPLFAVIAAGIKLGSRGPVLFRQDRVGLKRKIFRMHKFRTMYVDAEERIEELEADNEVNGAAFKMANDPRITKVGRTLRRLSLDELPQFYDVLVGNMSLVGPRPLPGRDVERFEKSWQKRRFSVKPGLTCLWQVNGRHEVEFENWMELDLEYIDNWSLSLDFDILMKTLPAVMRGTGAT